MKPRIFTVRHKQEGLRVRDLRPGMIVPIGDGTATVKVAYFMDGKEARLLSHEGRTALAMKVEFHDHEPVIAHPAERVR